MSKRLLLADDSITIQKVIQITFAHEDYQLTITDNGDTALAKAKELSPDLVLADVYMPGRNGYELCAAIKQTPGLQHVPVLLLAGSFEPFDEAKARAAGADGWIEKPFESQALIDKVATLLAAAPAQAPPPAPEVVVPEPSITEPAVPELDPFADISFDEPPATVAPVPVAADDWSDLNEVPGISRDVFDEPQGAAPVFEFAEAEAVFEEKEPALAPANEVETFEGADEIMALGDDDILAAEDLEPLGELPTLTPWSRDELPADELSETFTEFSTPSEPEPETPRTVVPETVNFAAPAPAVAEPVQEIPPIATSTEEAPAAAVEQRVATLTETEIEQIVERAVGKVIEKLAGSVLERIAWEVVPDLAEALIKEEIRKIKDAAA